MRRSPPGRDGLRPRFVDEIEWRLRHPPESRESTGGGDVANARLTGLGAEGKAHVL
jgi:hypothetical protein